VGDLVFGWTVLSLFSVGPVKVGWVEGGEDARVLGVSWWLCWLGLLDAWFLRLVTGNGEGLG